jgi:tRNA modification GTPase
MIPDSNQTIVAVSTAPGYGAIAIIRLSGKNAFEISSKFFSPNPVFKNPKPNHTHVLKVLDGTNLIDNVIVVLYLEPKSYTGENMVEIFCHGSPYIIGKISMLAIKNGARQAAPGEFTMRAFLNGKLDLIQAEAINDLILSENEAAHKAAINQVQGSVTRHITRIKNEIVKLLVEIEARLDDSDGEIPEIDSTEFQAHIEKIASNIKNLAHSFEHGKYIKHGIKVSIVGAPNSGKSSLLNALLGYKRVIVSDIAGTTRDTIEEKLTISGLSVIFIDTAGINRHAANPLEKEGIRRTIKAIKSCDILLWVQDSSKPFDDSDKLISECINKNSSPQTRVITVINKIDLKPKRLIHSDKDMVCTSCKTQEGIEKLKEMIVHIQEKICVSESSAIITSARHFQALTNALKELTAVSRLIIPPPACPKTSRRDVGAEAGGGVTDADIGNSKQIQIELIAEHLRACLNELASTVGETTSEQILSNIFEKFCVGK